MFDHRMFLMAQKYHDTILRPIVTSFAEAFNESFMLQDYNTHSHHGWIINDYLNALDEVGCFHT